MTAIIRTRGRPSLFEEALASVLSQTVDDLEVVVVEDGGTSYTAASAASGPRPPIRVRRLRDDGVAVATRIGLEMAKGRYVAFLDDDDLWDPTMLETLCGHLDAHPEASLAFCRRRCIDETGKSVGDVDPRAAAPTPQWPTGRAGPIRPFVEEALVTPVVHVAQSAVIRRASLDPSRLEARFGTAWDRAISALACSDGASAVWEPRTLASYRVHRHSLTSGAAPERHDGAIELYRTLVDDGRLEPWRGPLRRVLSDLLLDRALLVERPESLPASRRDAAEALRCAVTARSARTLVALCLPFGVVDRVRRVTRTRRRVRGAAT